nr:hypothetical protein [Pseudonocardia ammonioxydans]
MRGGGGATGTQNPDFWPAKTSEILRCYLLAAALTGQGMSEVMAWPLRPEDRTPVSTLAGQGPTYRRAGWARWPVGGEQGLAQRHHAEDLAARSATCHSTCRGTGPGPSSHVWSRRAHGAPAASTG